MTDVSFTVNCKAVPQGSKTGFVVPGKNGKPRAVVVDVKQKAMRSYRMEVRDAAMRTLEGIGIVYPMAGEKVAIEVSMEFSFIRPASCKKRVYPSVKPDIDKLERATLDALTGILFADDSQVVSSRTAKVYGDVERVRIRARLMEGKLFQ